MHTVVRMAGVSGVADMAVVRGCAVLVRGMACVNVLGQPRAGIHCHGKCGKSKAAENNAIIYKAEAAGLPRLIIYKESSFFLYPRKHPEKVKVKVYKYFFLNGSVQKVQIKNK